MRIRRFLLLIILGCFVGAAPAFSQEDLDETYIAPDDSFQFSYPGDWEVDDESFEDIGFVSLSGEVGRDTVFITFMGPEFVDVLAPDAGDVEEAAEDLGLIFGFDDIEIFEIEEREVAISSFALEEVSGIAFVIDFTDGGFGGALVSAEEEDSFEDED